MSVHSTPVQVTLFEGPPAFRVALDQAPRELALLNQSFPFTPCTERRWISENTIKPQAARADPKLGARN